MSEQDNVALLLSQIGHLDFSAFVLLFLRRFFMCSKGV